jgi:putative transposase
VERVRKTGSAAPGQVGGYKPKGIAKQDRAWLLARVEERDFTIRGLVVEFAERGLKDAARHEAHRQGPARPSEPCQEYAPVSV